MMRRRNIVVSLMAISVLLLLVAPVQPAAAASTGGGLSLGSASGNQTIISPNGLPEATYGSTNGTSPTSAALNPSLPCIPCPHYVTYVYFTCPDGSISLSGVGTVCHDVSGSTLGYTCKSSSGCSIGMSGSDDSSYFFYGWDDSTYSTISGQGQSVTLDVTTTYNVNMGFITYINGPMLTMTASTFVNWSTPWSYGMVQVCPNNPFGVCHSRSTSGAYGDQLYEPQGFTYTITPQNASYGGVGAGLPENWVVHQWNSTMGDATGLSYDHATMYFQDSGTISMYAQTAPTLHWAGFVYSPSSPFTTVYRVSGKFYVPNASAGGPQAVWSGIGGQSNSSNLWQAGVNVNSTGIVAAWWEAVASTGSTLRWGTIAVSSTNLVTIVVSSGGGHSTFWINDTTNGNRWTNSGSAQSFTPDATSGEWIDEPQVDIRHVALFMYCSEMSVNGATASLQSGYLVPYTSRTISISQMYLGGSFSENNGY